MLRLVRYLPVLAHTARAKAAVETGLAPGRMLLAQFTPGTAPSALLAA